jgi:hypothetical protein
MGFLDIEVVKTPRSHARLAIEPATSPDEA